MKGWPTNPSQGTGTPGYVGPTGQPHAKLLYNSECCLKLADLKAIQTQQRKTHIYFKIR